MVALAAKRADFEAGATKVGSPGSGRQFSLFPGAQFVSGVSESEPRCRRVGSARFGWLEDGAFDSRCPEVGRDDLFRSLENANFACL